MWIRKNAVVAIQDRDPLPVPSTRRNPLLADIFERLGYMERKGSGFGKIIDAYEFQTNYTKDKKPYFHSNRANFVAVMPNLNYDGTQGDHQDDTYTIVKLKLTMHCFMCQLKGGHLVRWEHEDARWLAPAELGSVDWLPADEGIVGKFGNP